MRPAQSAALQRSAFGDFSQMLPNDAISNRAERTVGAVQGAQKTPEVSCPKLQQAHHLQGLRVCGPKLGLSGRQLPVSGYCPQQESLALMAVQADSTASSIPSINLAQSRTSEKQFLI